jgi:hypothetical protein
VAGFGHFEDYDAWANAADDPTIYEHAQRWADEQGVSLEEALDPEGLYMALIAEAQEQDWKFAADSAWFMILALDGSIDPDDEETWGPYE